jgi:hypothetical protein
MDHDAAALSLNPAAAVPPYEPKTVRLTGLTGLGMIALAGVIGLVALSIGKESPASLDTARLFLVLIGIITVGAAISMRPDLWWAWGIGTIACVLTVGGLPSHWDSFRVFFAVVSGVAAAGTVFCLLAPTWRYVAFTAILLFHFVGIFMATTAPPSTPWLSEQLFRRIYNPYLQFVYLRNAYHFYSPEPGPASVLAFMLKTDTGRFDPVTGKKEFETKWVVLPTRPANIRDPLGLGYYRQLSLNEQTARGSVGLVTPSDQFEKTEMYYRRDIMQVKIPYHPADQHMFQYKLPNSDVARYILPSYASHVIVWHTPDKETAARTTVKIYRLEHRDLPPEQLSAGYSPYHPGTYRPYFLGEFDARGHLTDPREVFLYWMLPIIPMPNPLPNNPANPYMKDYQDYLSVHALDISPEEVLLADPNAGRVFNWSKLR